jgi:hypothetical protein
MVQGPQPGQSCESKEELLNAVTHAMLLIPRPRRGDEVAVRTPGGMRWMDVTSQGQLSDKVCQVCGYGPTELQEQKSLDGRAVTYRAASLATLPW